MNRVARASFSTMTDRQPLTRFAWMLIAAAVLTLLLKGGAYFVTGSVGLLSDAMESLINLAAALLAFTVLKIAAQPPDEEHAYGHEKAEYFSSGVEGTLIILAAFAIAATGIQRLLNPQTLHRLDLGLAIAVAASAINFVVARALLRAGFRHRSITLEAAARHLMTDVWTSMGILAGVGSVALTGWLRLDPLIGLLVAGHIVWTGLRLVGRSTLGLMDTALPRGEIQVTREILESYAEQGATYHALRTRQAGARSFVSVHIQVPGDWSVQEGHDLLEMIERDIRTALPHVTVFTHLEPVEDPRSWADQHLDRTPTGQSQ